MAKRINCEVEGRSFGRWTAVRLEWTGRRTLVRCRCSCGNEGLRSLRSLRTGKTKSCGCSQFTHGKSETPEYRAWHDMICRCTNPNLKCYRHYGARGITVCERWMKFENFFADMGYRPSKKHSLERIKNHLGYKPSNCVWATKDQQCNNTRRCIFVTWKGKTQSVTKWATECGIARTCIYHRLRQGWPIKKALTVGFYRGKKGKGL